MEAEGSDWRWHEYCLAAYDGEEIVGVAVFRVRGGVAHVSNVITCAAGGGEASAVRLLKSA